MKTLDEAAKIAAKLSLTLLNGGKDMTLVAAAEAGNCILLSRIYDTPSDEIQNMVHKEFKRITSH